MILKIWYTKYQNNSLQFTYEMLPIFFVMDKHYGSAINVLGQRSLIELTSAGSLTRRGVAERLSLKDNKDVSWLVLDVEKTSTREKQQ